MLSGDEPQNAAQRSDVLNAIYCPIHWEEQVRTFYEDVTTQLVEAKSERLRGNLFQLDAVREYVWEDAVLLEIRRLTWPV
jgi:hypothetical protein